MKKLLIWVVALSMVFALTACSTSTSTPASSSSDSASSTTEKEETQTPEEKDSSTEEVEASSNEDSSPKEESPAQSQEISFDEFTPIDNDECAVTIKSLDPDSFWGYTIKVALENKSADKTYMYSVETASINGVEADPFFASEVAPGKKANNEINFTSFDYEETGIKEITDIELIFKVYDTNDWMADPVALESCHIYPLGQENAVQYVRESQATDNVLVDNEDITVIVTEQGMDSIWGYTVHLYFVNKTDVEVMFSVDDASVNGFMADPFFARSVQPGKCAFTTMSWSEETLKENDISEIEEIEFTLKASDSNDWLADDIFNEVITLKP
jgi:hypothetical protein